MNDERRVLIVRIWWEHDPQMAAPILRGSLQQVGSDHTRYFISVDGLLQLLHVALTPTPAEPLNDSPVP